MCNKDTYGFYKTFVSLYVCCVSAWGFGSKTLKATVLEQECTNFNWLPFCNLFEWEVLKIMPWESPCPMQCTHDALRGCEQMRGAALGQTDSLWCWPEVTLNCAIFHVFKTCCSSTAPYIYMPQDTHGPNDWPVTSGWQNWGMICSFLLCICLFYILSIYYYCKNNKVTT